MSESAVSLLNSGLQRMIFEMGWKRLRPIQEESIRTLLKSDRHALICAATASGKTEAAFLPIISRLAESKAESIQAIYIGPLKALINDQFGRLEQLCDRLEIEVHRWHGDIPAAKKESLRKKPGGILLITPESLESNFINFGSQVPRLYRDLSFVVIDELHSFLGNVRGVHLLSLLARLRSQTGRIPQVVGLSATLGDPEVGKRYLCVDAPSTVTLISDSGTERRIRLGIKAVLRKANVDPSKDPSLPTAENASLRIRSLDNSTLLMAGSAEANGNLRSTDRNSQSELEEIVRDIGKHFSTSTNLIFVNSKRVAEEIAVRAHDMALRNGWPHDPFKVHHGSVSKEIRGDAEESLKNGAPTTVICSSTLEMGVDIGSVRAIGQIDPPWTVSSFVQRLGRSGRREGECSTMRLYVREELPHSNSSLTSLLFPDLLRAISLTRLMQRKWLEPIEENRFHFSTLIHQIFSYLRQTGGVQAQDLFEALVEKGPFRRITKSDFVGVLRGLSARRLIEQLPTKELVLAPEGERITAAQDFYAAFKGTELYVIRQDDTRIGELSEDSLPPIGQLTVLGGKRWMLKAVDHCTRTAWVIPANSGKLPVFVSSGGEIQTQVLEEMKALLRGTDEPSFLDAPALELLRCSRYVAKTVGLHESDFLVVPGGVRWFPWVGTRCLKTLSIMATMCGLSGETDRLSICLPVRTLRDFCAFLGQMKQCDPAEIGACVTPREVEKFDEFLAEDLLDKACQFERVATAEAIGTIEKTIRSLSVLAK